MMGSNVNMSCSLTICVIIRKKNPFIFHSSNNVGYFGLFLVASKIFSSNMTSFISFKYAKTSAATDDKVTFYPEFDINEN